MLNADSVDIIATLFYAIAIFAAAIAFLALFRDRSARGRKVFCVGVLLLAAQTFLAALIYRSTSEAEAASWRTLWLLPQALAPPVWLVFVLRYSRGNFESSFRKWLPLILGSTLLPLLTVTLFQDDVLTVTTRRTAGWDFHIGLAGFVLYLCVVLCSALILINLERTFRATVGIMRWRVKFIILGTAVIFVAKLYTASQVLLFKTHTASSDIVSAAALLVATIFFVRGFLRAGIFQVQVYPSEQVLQYSVAGVLIGAYLVLIGIFSKLFEGWNTAEAFAVKAFLLLASLAALGVLLLSDRLRDKLKRWISHHFHRPFYDYRAIWLSFTEKTTTILDPEDLSRTIANWLSEQLHVLSTSIWLIDPETQSIRAAASTGISSSNLELTGATAAEIIDGLSRESAPFDIDKRSESWTRPLKQFYPDHFADAGNRVCVPFIAAGRLVGFCTLGDRVNYIPMEVQEFELLKCIADQLAASLLNLQLSSRLIQSKEMEAFQTISAFFVHDLKNTASTLNLTLQNLPRHFDNPEFRKDALKAIGKSVNHIQELISRLSLFRQKLELNRSILDLNDIVRSSLGALKGAPMPIRTDLLELRPISADAEQLQKVVTNLILNARDALKENGQIEIATTQKNGEAVLAVSDNGCGMPPEFLSRSLFRPFKTTKKGGIGIGMFQSKAIVEAHGGRIAVESEVGRGTTFRIYLPAVQ